MNAISSICIPSMYQSILSYSDRIVVASNYLTQILVQKAPVPNKERGGCGDSLFHFRPLVEKQKLQNLVGLTHAIVNANSL